MNLLALRNRARDLLLEASAAQFTDAQINNWLNEGQQELQRKTLWLQRKFDYSNQPIRIVSGTGNTTLSTPQGIGYDPQLEQLWVADKTLKAILVFKRRDSGDIAPSFSIKGPANTTLTAPIGLFVDWANREVFVVDGNAVKVWNLTDTGDVAPKRTLTGAATLLNSPTGIFVDVVNGEMIVANTGGPGILVFQRTDTGNTAPTRNLTGAATTLTTPQGVYTDVTNGELVVADAGKGVLVFQRTDTGNTAPTRSITGTGITPRGIWVDETNGEYYVTVESASNFKYMAILALLRGDNGALSAPDRIVWQAPAQLKPNVYQPMYLYFDSAMNEVYVTYRGPAAIAAHVCRGTNVQEVELPPDLFAVEAVSTDGWPCEQTDFREAIQPALPVGRPSYFWVKSEAGYLVLGFYPSLGGNYDIIAYVNPKPSTMVLDTDLPDFPEPYQDTIVQWACYKGKIRDSEFQEAAVFFQVFENRVSEMTADRELRMSQIYNKIRDESGGVEMDLAHGTTFVP